MAIFTTGQAGGQAVQPTSVPAAYTTDALDLARSQRLAQMLTSSPVPEGQMISGRYVAPSITQNLAQFANMATGAYFADKAEKQNQALAEKLRKGEAEAFADFMKIKQGRPAVEGGVYGPDGKLTMQTTADMIGPQGELTPQYRQVAPVAGVAPNPQAAYANLYQDPRSPQRLRDLAFTKMMADPEAFTLSKGAVRFEKQPDGSIKQVAAGAEDLPDSIKYAISIGRLPSDPKTWTEQQANYAKQLVESKSAAGAMNLGQKGFDNTLKLRGDFRSEPVYKDFQAIDGAYRQINKSLDAGTAAGDLAASTKLMKLLDPTSVVRESELAMAMQATGKLDQLYNYANKIVTGEFLSPKQKSEFRTLATEFYNSAGEQYNIKRGEYADIANRNQMNVLDVVGAEVKLKPQIIKTPEGKNKPASAKNNPPAPQGFDQNLWNVMTPQERELFK
jgi:hypothetical protein